MRAFFGIFFGKSLLKYNNTHKIFPNLFDLILKFLSKK